MTQQADMWEGVGRNDPCPCGSGRKFKHCHGRPGGSSRAEVLYIHPSKQGVDFDQDGAQTSRAYGWIPVGVVGLVNLLRENGIWVTGLDYPLEINLNQGFDVRRWLGEQRDARVVMIDLHWHEHSYGAISIARVCKEVLPEAWTVMGGFTASAYASEILARFPEVDFIIRGDAEQPLLSLVQRLMRRVRRARRGVDLAAIPNLSYRDGDRIVENERTYCATPADLDALNFVDIDFLEHYEQYNIRSFGGHWLSIARGCRYECAFCGGCRTAQRMLAGRKGMVARSPAKVVEDLMRLGDLGHRRVSLSYDLSLLGEGYWREFFSRLGDSGLQIGLWNELYQLPPDEFIEEFIAGVVIPHSALTLSPLSGCERVRRLNGKSYSNDELFHILEILKRHEMQLIVCFSLNLPGEDEQTFEETLALAEKIYDLYPSHLIRMVNSCHTVDPYSPMSMHPERYSIEVSMSTFMDYYEYCRSTALMGQGARTGMHRGFRTAGSETRRLGIMAEKWDAMSAGRESSWMVIPSSW